MDKEKIEELNACVEKRCEELRILNETTQKDIEAIQRKLAQIELLTKELQALEKIARC
jgi:hypothetical protein